MPVMPTTPTVAEPPASVETVPVGLWQFYAYFLRLGATGFWRSHRAAEHERTGLIVAASSPEA